LYSCSNAAYIIDFHSKKKSISRFFDEKAFFTVDQNIIIDVSNAKKMIDD
jgi:hypothetical protein